MALTTPTMVVLYSHSPAMRDYRGTGAKTTRIHAGETYVHVHGCVHVHGHVPSRDQMFTMQAYAADLEAESIYT